MLLHNFDKILVTHEASICCIAASTNAKFSFYNDHSIVSKERERETEWDKCVYISYISCQIFCYVTDYDSRPARVSSINVLFFSLLLFQDLRIVNSNMHMLCNNILYSVHSKDETVTFDITLMNRKGSASVDSTVSSRSQFDNRYILTSYV